MKRTFDLIVSGTIILVLAPCILLVAGLVRWKLGSPILFQQLRPGLHGKPFKLKKFRTMLDRNDGSGHPLPDADRLTRFGRLLRSTSLDELPSLWNVVVGDLALVGPRPLLMDYLALYDAEQARRHEVRPGITGWAQVNGRNNLTWEEKFNLDVWYVNNRSFLLDLRILSLTVARVFQRDGISADGDATMPRFTGTKVP